MPFVWKTQITIKDEKGAQSRLTYYAEYAQETLDAPTIEVFGPADHARYIARLLDRLIGGVITNISINLNVPLPDGIKANAESSSDVEQGITLTYGVLQILNPGTAEETAVPTTWKRRIRIPTWKEDFLLETGELDQAAYYAALPTLFPAPDFGNQKDIFAEFTGFDGSSIEDVGSGTDQRGNPLGFSFEAKENFRSR